MAKIYDDPDYWFAGTPKKPKNQQVVVVCHLLVLLDQIIMPKKPL